MLSLLFIYFYLHVNLHAFKIVFDCQAFQAREIPLIVHFELNVQFWNFFFFFFSGGFEKYVRDKLPVYKKVYCSKKEKIKRNERLSNV